MAWNEDKFGERPLRRDDQSDFRNAPWSVVTKRFNVNTPVKASENIRTLYEINKKAQEVVVPVILTRIASMAAFIFRRS